MVGSRQLVVVRHAKSAWPRGVPDRARPLAHRGLGDAPRMGRHIGALVGAVDLVVLSPATRAQQTWELMAPHVAHHEVRTDERVYRDFGDQLPEVVADLPDAAARVLILGHEPGLSHLLLSLSDRARPDLRDRIADKFPTCAVAVLGVEGPWARAAPGCAQLQALTTPRD